MADEQQTEVAWPSCVECGERPQLSMWNVYCDACFERYLDRLDRAERRIKECWPSLGGRVVNAVASFAAREHGDPVAVVERMTNTDLLSIRNMGQKSLAQFRAAVPEPTPVEHDVNERAERAILSAAEAYRLVEEARQMRQERDAADATIGRLIKALDLAEGYIRAWAERGDGGAEATLRMIVERRAIRG
jgi:hypothetical protein